MSDGKAPWSIYYKDPQKPSITLDPDGTINRNLQFPTIPATPSSNVATVLSKDVPLNPKHNTGLRIFVPRQAPDNPSAAKLPVVVYYHGGGFVLLSAASSVNHDFCVEMANQLPAVIVSVDYRLAPEHRLPAAYEDAIDALHWIKSTDDRWIRDFADYNNCFLMGSSAGGNIAYHAGLMAPVHDLQPLNLRGLILQQPFFGGLERTGSERRLAGNPYLPLSASDLLWELGLPVGANRDHGYCNPAVCDGPKELDRVRFMGWRVLVSGCEGDPLIDRQIELGKILESKGVSVTTEFTKGGYHGDSTQRDALFVLMKKFIYGPP